MTSMFKSGFAACAALVAQAAAMIALPAAVNPAQAEMIAFWEDDKPSVTGSSRRASKKRLPAEYSDSDSDNEPSARPRKKARAAARDEQSGDEPSPRKKQRKVRVASLGGSEGDYDPRPSRKSLSGGGNITWAASAGCLNGTLASIVQDVASSYGALTVSSTCRSHGHNASVGGAKKSQHLTGDAVDFRVHGNVSGAMAYLRNHGSVGGFHHYGGGLFHIDTGPKRTW